MARISDRDRSPFEEAHNPLDKFTYTEQVSIGKLAVALKRQQECLPELARIPPARNELFKQPYCH
ncbi:MAG: hypothetical protein WB384_01505 [Candidatus Sulfotelmatobacter sp.]